MSEIIESGDISIRVTRKAIKHVHLSVHPPHGRVTLVASTQTRLEVARAYAISKLGGFGTSSQNCALRPAKRRAGLSNGKRIIFGVGAIS
jgi:hypothetical protein